MNSKLKYIFSGLLLASCVLTTPANAASFFNGARLGYGYHDKDNLHGPRLALIWDWPKWFNDFAFQLTGHWDVSAAYWRNDGDNGRFKDTFTFAAAPILRIQVNDELYDPIVLPYIEGGAGVAMHTSRYIGSRDLGGAFGFENIIGGGIMFGSRRQFDISYHYIHYSNAGIFSPNDGLDLQFIFSFAYRWK